MSSSYRKTLSERRSYAARRIEQLEELIEQNAGLQSVSVNGTATTYTDLLKQREYWIGEIARLEGRVRRFETINLGGFQ